jgi:phosphatidylserine decarboxylase
LVLLFMPPDMPPANEILSPAVSDAGPSSAARRAAIESLDPAVKSIQPGGGVCMRLELLWGHARRAWLKTFRRGYVERMRQLRRGAARGCPHEVLDPRDLKFFRNQTDCHWAAKDDPFTWRDGLPLVRAGLAEAILLGGLFFALAAAASLWSVWAALPPAVLGLLTLWFFRNPRRIAPAEAGLVVSPADGRVVSVEEIEHDEFLGGPAVEIGIFLSVFDVHINRVPADVRVIGLTYRRGKFLNALLPASARENEQLAVRLEENEPPHRRYIVRQIAGAIARRIVCWVRPGEDLERGQMFGMIKFGSRTELVLPRDQQLAVVARPGQRVSAGTTVLARYEVQGLSDSPTDAKEDAAFISQGDA